MCKKIQSIGIPSSVIGWAMVILVWALPMWKATKFVGSNISTVLQGLWMICEVQSTGLQCKGYDSALALAPDFQAARAMITISILAGIGGVIMLLTCYKCTTCIKWESSKARGYTLAGILFIFSGLLCLISVSWSAIAIAVSRNVLEDRYHELGAALYIGWAAAALLMIGGGVLWNRPTKQALPMYQTQDLLLTPVTTVSTPRYV